MFSCCGQPAEKIGNGQLSGRMGRPSQKPESPVMAITRIEPGKRMSNAVVHNKTVYLAGQIGSPKGDVKSQAVEALAEVDRLLAAAGTDKTRILQAIVWLADMADFAAMNEIWEGWVAPGNTPARATGEAKLAAPEYKVEFIITAALPD